MSKFINVYTCYDDTKRIIGRLRNGTTEISKARYNQLLKKRTIGGIAGIYTDAEYTIDVVHPKYGVVNTL